MPEISEAELKELQQLREAERYRRGEPDAVSGAFHVYALTQGALLRHEYDVSIHGHEGHHWEVGAIVVDPLTLIRVNQEHGFKVGDAALRAIAGTLQAAWPTAKVVRIHSDAFAVLLPPSAEVGMAAELEQTARAALLSGVPERMKAAGAPAVALEFSVSLLHLLVEQPSHWQVLGPLVWAECERAHVMARSGQATGVQRRRIALDASIPLRR